VATDAVVKLAPSHTFDDAPSPFAVVVPGGGQPTLAACEPDDPTVERPHIAPSRWYLTQERIGTLCRNSSGERSGEFVS
jgi:hypothetical protein